MAIKRLAETNNMSREEWLSIRKQGLGGSDAAAIIGLSRFATLFSVWADKTGRMPEKSMDERMRLGVVLEPHVAGRFTDITKKKVRRLNAVLSNDDYPFALANIDRAVVGERAGLECKTTSVLNLPQFRNGEYPDEYYTQCVHYLAVTGWDRWYLTVLVLGSADEPKVHVIERNEDEIKALMDAERAFWADYVETDTPPPVDGQAPTLSALGSVYQGGESEVASLTQFDSISSYMALDAQIKALEGQQDKIKQMIMAELGDYEKGECGTYSVSWASRERNTFDHKTFLKDHPRLDASKYFKISKYRQFSIKEAKSS